LKPSSYLLLNLHKAKGGGSAKLRKNTTKTRATNMNEHVRGVIEM
jgi:hypothetical protein